MSEYNVKNYTEPGGEVTHIGGQLVFDEGAGITGFPGAANLTPKTTNTAADIRDDLNKLIIALKNAGVMIPDEWDVSARFCSTPSAMPTAETASNSEHANVMIDGTEITVNLDCDIADLEDADHGETWGTHKWLGFGVSTGLASIIGVTFTDDTGAETVLSSADAAEAASLGLSAGAFVLYIKADQPEYLTGDKHFSLSADGYAKTTFTIRIAESVPAQK